MTSLKDIPSQQELLNHWNAYIDHRDPQAREFLIRHYLPYVRARARHLHARFRGHVELDDMISCGVMGMMAAMDAYDPSRGATFETFCAHRVRGAILDEIRRNDWVPRMIRKQARDLAEAEQAAAVDVGHILNDAELAEFMRIAPQKVTELRKVDQEARMVSLESLTQSPDNDSHHTFDFAQFADDRADTADHRLMAAELTGILEANLNETERQLMTMYYLDGMKMKQIGQALNLSESRISQMHSTIVERLRRKLNKSEPSSRMSVRFGTGVATLSSSSFRDRHAQQHGTRVAA